MKIEWNPCSDGDLSHPGSRHHVKKSSPRVSSSNSKFNASKSNGKSGKQRGIKWKLPKTLAKKKWWKIVRVKNNCDIINLKILYVCHVITRTQSSPRKRLQSINANSGYHHIEIRPRHLRFVGFAWEFPGGASLWYFVFTIVSSGPSSAPYIFTKFLKPFKNY